MALPMLAAATLLTATAPGLLVNSDCAFAMAKLWLSAGPVAAVKLALRSSELGGQ